VIRLRISYVASELHETLEDVSPRSTTLEFFNPIPSFVAQMIYYYYIERIAQLVFSIKENL